MHIYDKLWSGKKLKLIYLTIKHIIIVLHIT